MNVVRIRFVQGYLITANVTAAKPLLLPGNTIVPGGFHLCHHLSNYEQIIRYLRLMRPLYQRLDALDEWQAIVDDLRHRYPGRKVLMEMLDTL